MLFHAIWGQQTVVRAPPVALEPLSASLQVTLRLESTLLGCLRGQPPDPFWVGPVDTDAFMGLTAELLTLLSQRDCQGVWTLADHLAGVDWWDGPYLGLSGGNRLGMAGPPEQSAEVDGFSGQVFARPSCA